mmetsp:Transcript_11127/g.17065  ORF Transcript_11127/g.17065 Transcript_11127/m.17065 type:complete len:388 (+) Transcript_11127:2-1165(+)
MKIIHAALLSFLGNTANGFTAVPYSSISMSSSRSSVMKMATSADDEVAALRSAAAKAREDANRLAVELGKDPDVVAEKISKTKQSISVQEVSSKIENVKFEQGDAVSQANTLDALVEDGDLVLWKSAGSDQGMRTYPVSLQYLDRQTNGRVNGDTLGIAGDKEVTLEDFQDTTIKVVVVSSALAIASLALLPENIGPTLCYFLALVPIAFIGVGSTAPGLIAEAIVRLRGGTADEEDDRLDRICRHESAHLLCGYLCGLPVKEYTVMEDTGIPCVEFHSSSNGDVTSREFTQEEVATLSVVAMSGSVGEILKYETAKGGENDLIGLQNIFRKSQDFIGSEKQQELTRWGALTAYQLLIKNADKFEELVKAVRAKKSVLECIAIMEAR